MAEPDLKNLPAEDRIKKLKELQEKKKKELEEAQKQIKESEEEITQERRFKEKVPIPQVAKVDITDATAEEKEIIRIHKGLKEAKKENLESKSQEKSSKEVSLEEMAKAAQDLPLDVLNSDYTLQLSRQPVREIYQEMRSIYQEVGEKGYISSEEERRVTYLASAVERKREEVEEGNYSFIGAAALAASVTQQMGAKLRGMYKK